jgi:hypothetical protein
VMTPSLTSPFSTALTLPRIVRTPGVTAPLHPA